MVDSSPENTETSRDWQNLPILSRDSEGKRVIPMKINLTNLDLRINGDENRYQNEYKKVDKKRERLIIEVAEHESVNKLFAEAHDFIQKWRDKKTTTLEDYRPIATYLDWSYQQQFGVPASSLPPDEKLPEYGVSTDIVLLFRNIRGKLNGKN